MYIRTKKFLLKVEYLLCLEESISLNLFYDLFDIYYLFYEIVADRFPLDLCIFRWIIFAFEPSNGIFLGSSRFSFVERNSFLLEELKFPLFALLSLSIYIYRRASWERSYLISRASLILEKWEIPAERPLFTGTGIFRLSVLSLSSPSFVCHRLRNEVLY